MTFIKSLSNSIPITAPEAQSETISQPQAQTNFGVANTADTFQTSNSNNFELLEQQPQNLSLMQPATTDAVTVDASSLYNYVSQPENRLEQLSQRLELLKHKKNELTKQIYETDKQKSEIEKTITAVDRSLKNDEPLSEEAATALEALGVLGVIGGVLTGLPVVSLLGSLLGGLSAGYKEKLKQAKEELKHQLAEADQSAHEYASQLEDTQKEEGSVLELIEEEQRRLEQGFDERKFDTDLVTAEGPWEQFRPAESLTLNDDASSAVPFSKYKALSQTDGRLMQSTAEQDRLLGEKETYSYVIDKMSELKGSRAEQIPNSRQESLASESVIQNNDSPSTVQFDPDIQKFTREE